MKVTNLSLKKQIKLVEKTQTICNEIISLKYTQPQKRDNLLKNLLQQSNPLKRDLQLLQINSQKESKKETSKLKRRFTSLKKLCTQLHINMNDKNGNKLDIYKLKIRVNQKKSYLLKKDNSFGVNTLGKDFFPLLNQTQLSKILGLSNSVIKFLKGTDVLQWKKVQGRIYFSHSSIEKFQDTFDINDYLTISESKKILESYEFYDDYYKRMSITKFDFSITVVRLMKTDKSNYELDTVKFGSTVFITKKSMNRCIENLKELENQQNKPSTQPIKRLAQKKNKGTSTIRLNIFPNKFRKKSLTI